MRIVVTDPAKPVVSSVNINEAEPGVYESKEYYCIIPLYNDQNIGIFIVKTGHRSYSTKLNEVVDKMYTPYKGAITFTNEE